MIAQRFFSEERRKDPRLADNIPVKISKDDGDVVTETLNISRTGAYCRVSQFIEPMVKLKIHMLLPLHKGKKLLTKKISCQGVVVRSEPEDNRKHFRVAIFFNEINKRDAEYIAEFVRNQLVHGRDGHPTGQS